ncbi:DUF2341 domain-containing protein [Aquabacterium sp.]|uniref:DUF2341 domain-containing protein n=1 Tax=Aquabacterium sp. TaxID=1872578 RepID=UPI0024879BC4|nr:DUF2341 domain-containing protein [Aquabacterium sp.]MDI1257883.1 DUF2341 domain-containing protein [Aquabacterium sp.]
MKAVKKSLLLVALCGGLLSTSAHAWWDAGFKHRTKVTLNTTAQGIETKEALSGAVVPVRLHSGNFDFLSAKPDGSDLRVVAADDKTPMKFWVERFDGTNELAVVWVQLSSVAPGTDKNLIHVYAGNEKAVAESTSPAIFDGAMGAVLTFAEKDGPAADASGVIKTSLPVVRELTGLIGAAAKLDGEQSLTLAANDKLKAPAAGPYSISFWIKPETATGALVKQGPLAVLLDADKLSVTLGSAKATGGDLPVSSWAHVAVTVGAGKLTLYVNGAQSAQADLPAEAAAIEGDVVVGQGIKGLVDQLEIASTVRSADWLKFSHAAQSADAKLVVAVGQTEETASEGEGGDPGYFGILVGNLTVDAWVVIGILAVMFVISLWVMYVKALYVGRADKHNRVFLKMFREARDVMAVQAKGLEHSSLQRLYAAGLHELQKRDVGKEGAKPLSGASIDAVKAAIDADLVRESQDLNSNIVLLTIAIAGGPFLGLLGTVVGVMITFAAIAAAGDVNVNAIAPGIAAALLATVAGLAVAIPALFGYNYLASRIKNISSDMQIFIDEYVTRVAEIHGAR